MLKSVQITKTKARMRKQKDVGREWKRKNKIKIVGLNPNISIVTLKCKWSKLKYRNYQNEFLKNHPPPMCYLQETLFKHNICRFLLKGWKKIQYKQKSKQLGCPYWQQVKQTSEKRKLSWIKGKIDNKRVNSPRGHIPKCVPNNTASNTWSKICQHRTRRKNRQVQNCSWRHQNLSPRTDRQKISKDPGELNMTTDQWDLTCPIRAECEQLFVFIDIYQDKWYS